MTCKRPTINDRHEIESRRLKLERPVSVALLEVDCRPQVISIRYRNYEESEATCYLPNRQARQQIRAVLSFCSTALGTGGRTAPVCGECAHS
jgi:hypothetical protein